MATVDSIVTGPCDVDSLTKMVVRYLDYLKLINYPDTTIRAYRSDLGQLVEFFSDDPQLDYQDLRHWVKYLNSRYQPSTVSRKVGAVRSFFKFAKREGWVSESPARDLEPPRRDQHLPDIISQDAIQEMVDGMTNPRDRAILEVIYGGGLRVAELVALNVEDIQDGCARVMGKGGRERLCPLGGKALEALDVYLEGRTTGPLFLNRFGRRLSDRSVRNILPVNPHRYRHSFATHLLDAGADIRSVQELLGHRAIASTQQYTQVSTVLRKATHSRHPRA